MTRREAEYEREPTSRASAVGHGGRASGQSVVSRACRSDGDRGRVAERFAREATKHAGLAPEDRGAELAPRCRPPRFSRRGRYSERRRASMTRKRLRRLFDYAMAALALAFCFAVTAGARAQTVEL